MNEGNKIKELHNRMVKLFEQELTVADGYCKSGEPALSIEINNDGTWYAEIYSYLVNYPSDGVGGDGRHFGYTAKTFDELINKLDAAISKVEKEAIP